MAETTITLTEEDGASSLLEEGVEGTGNGTVHTEPAETGTTQADRERIAELERLHGRYREQLAGWDKHSRDLTSELQATRERLARLEGAAQGTQPRTEEAPRFAPGQLKTALTKWLNNDESDLDQLEQVLGRTLTRTPEQSQAFKPEDLKRIVREELVDLGTKGNVQSIVGRRHPDLANPQSPLSQAVWQTYDQYAADPENQLLYAKDPQREVPMIGPDGSQKMVDARLVDRLAIELKQGAAVQEGRRQEQRAGAVGGVMTGNGQTTRTNTRRTVEAVSLLSQAEVEYLSNPKTQRNWPKLPKEIKAAAKFYFDGLNQEEKDRRLAAYRSKAGVTA
jgi:hypothetical protein